jgi:hypothetical protein
MLDEMIQKIARYSNSQNKVSDADFFSNHPFHRAIEKHSRNIPAPRVAGAAFGLDHRFGHFRYAASGIR